MSPNPSESRYKRYIKDFEKRSSHTLVGGSDVMLVEDWLQRINRIFTVIKLKIDAIPINATSFQFTGEAIHWWDITLILNHIAMMK